MKKLQVTNNEKLRVATDALADAFGVERERFFEWAQTFLGSVSANVKVEVLIGPKVSVIIDAQKDNKSSPQAT